MLFKFPKRKIVLDCFTEYVSVIETSPIDFAIKHMPKWWKELPPIGPSKDGGLTPSVNMKHCAGMVDYYKNSIAIPLWSEVAIKVFKDKTYQWKFSDGKTKSVPHNLKIQATGFFNDYGHMKIVSPWFLKSDKNINWVWTQPTYSFPQEGEIVSLPAIVNYHYQHSCNINYLFPLDRERAFSIPHGTPIALLTPMTDKKIEIKRHLVSSHEMQKIESKHTKIGFIQQYQLRIKKMDKFSGCPYKDHIK